MKAEIFYFNNSIQQKQCVEIASALRRHVYKQISPSEFVIKVDDKKADKHLKRYLNLLKASTIKTSNFDIVIRDDRWKNYSYMGGHKTSPGHYLQLFHRSMPAIFPAVIVWNRLMMVPQNMHEAVEDHNVNWFLKPLDQEGVVLVDFQDKKAIDKAAEQVGLQLKQEIGKLCSRYMLARKILNPDFEELAGLLEIDVGYLEENRSAVMNAIVQLVLINTPDPVTLGESSDVTLELRNESENAYGSVHVRIRAPKDTVIVPESQFIEFSKAQKAVLKFKVTAKRGPFCPLEILFNLYDSQDAAPFPLPVMLRVSS